MRRHVNDSPSDDERQAFGLMPHLVSFKIHVIFPTCAIDFAELPETKLAFTPSKMPAVHLELFKIATGQRETVGELKLELDDHSSPIA